jgi:hypothetical protein
MHQRACMDGQDPVGDSRAPAKLDAASAIAIPDFVSETRLIATETAARAASFQLKI